MRMSVANNNRTQLTYKYMFLYLYCINIYFIYVLCMCTYLLVSQQLLLPYNTLVFHPHD